MIRSIRWRLVLAGALALLLALAAAGAGLALLFERHVERVAIADLQTRALALAAMVEPQPSAPPSLRTVPLDPLYDQPLSGHYWQLELGDQTHRSRSLWDYVLPTDQPPPPVGGSVAHALPGPRGEPLLVVEQALAVGGGDQPVPLRILIATDRQELDLAREGFMGDLLPFLALIGGLLLAASWAQITVGLRPLAQVGARVAALGSGQRPRMGQDLPSEVIPLANEIDGLLDARDQELARARHRAANLAHGFKTPLQALLGDAALLRARGETEVATSIETISTAMRRHVDRELARARIQSDRNNTGADPAQIAAKLIGVLRRMPAGAGIDWQLRAAPDQRARIDPDDLTEALGALLENAMRYCHERVTVTVRTTTAPTGRVLIAIHDDGRGVPDPDLARLTQRGLSLDPEAGGQGIGLAVVSDIVDAAQGRLVLRNAQPGFTAELQLQAMPSP